MKSIITIIILFFINIIFSQNIDPTNGASKLGILSDMSNFSGGSIIFNKKTEVEGNIHLFKSWNNKGVIHIDKKDYRLGNVNFNMKTNNFESEIGKDSIFIFDVANIDYIYVNNRKFKSFYFPKKKKDLNFEIIYDGEDFKLLKGYEVGIKYGETDPLMVKKKVDTYFTIKKYYVRAGTDIQEISLKKKAILSLFKEKSDIVSVFVKKSKLSYKKEQDLKKIFQYYKTL